VDIQSPVIDKVNPRSREPGDTIRILSENFGDTQGNSVVHIGRKTFDSTILKIKLWSDAKIKTPNYKCKWFKGQEFRKQKVWVTVDGIDSKKERLKAVKPSTCPSI